MNSSSDDELKHAKNLIYSLDLSPVVERLIMFYNWSELEAREASEQYKHYIFILRKYADGKEYKLQEIPPSADMDEVWHNHIIFTEHYINFCNEVFGSYLHHHPHHGQGNSLDQNVLENMFETTQKLYFKETGDYIYAVRPKKNNLKKLLKRLKNKRPENSEEIKVYK